MVLLEYELVILALGARQQFTIIRNLFAFFFLVVNTIDQPISIFTSSIFKLITAFWDSNHQHISGLLPTRTGCPFLNFRAGNSAYLKKYQIGLCLTKFFPYQIYNIYNGWSKLVLGNISAPWNTYKQWDR